MQYATLACLLLAPSTVMAQSTATIAIGDPDATDSAMETSLSASDIVTSTICPTGAAQSRYESCSSSVDGKLDGCYEDDAACACKGAADGFNCLSSYCATNTELLCGASYIFNSICSEASQSLPISLASCPATLTAGFPDILGDFSSAAAAASSSSTASESRSMGNRMMSFSGSATSAGAQINTIASPSETSSSGAAMRRKSGGEDGVLGVVMSVGILVAVAAGRLAAFL